MYIFLSKYCNIGTKKDYYFTTTGFGDVFPDEADGGSTHYIEAFEAANVVINDMSKKIGKEGIKK